MRGKFWGIVSDPDCGTKAFQEPMLADVPAGQHGACIKLPAPWLFLRCLSPVGSLLQHASQQSLPLSPGTGPTSLLVPPPQNHSTAKCLSAGGRTRGSREAADQEGQTLPLGPAGPFTESFAASAPPPGSPQNCQGPLHPCSPSSPTSTTCGGGLMASVALIFHSPWFDALWRVTRPFLSRWKWSLSTYWICELWLMEYSRSDTWQFQTSVVKGFPSLSCEGPIRLAHWSLEEHESLMEHSSQLTVPVTTVLSSPTASHVNKSSWDQEKCLAKPSRNQQSCPADHSRHISNRYLLQYATCGCLSCSIIMARGSRHTQTENWEPTPTSAINSPHTLVPVHWQGETAFLLAWNILSLALFSYLLSLHVITACLRSPYAAISPAESPLLQIHHRVTLPLELLHPTQAGGSESSSASAHSQTRIPGHCIFFWITLGPEQWLIYNTTLLASAQLDVLLKSQWYFWQEAIDSKCAVKATLLYLGKHGPQQPPR